MKAILKKYSPDNAELAEFKARPMLEEVTGPSSSPE